MGKQKAKKWWMLVWAFFFLTCVPFFYFGKKCNNKIWTAYGVVYLVLLGVLFALDDQFREAKWFEFGRLIFWLCGMTHTYYMLDSFSKRKMELDQNDETEQLSNEINYVEQIKEHFVEKEQQRAVQTAKIGNLHEKKENNTIDINSCGESDFASLPGVSIVMAKRAISYREEHHGFFSIEEFFDTIQLKPHFIVQIQDMVECKAFNNQAISEDYSTGRKLDL